MAMKDGLTKHEKFTAHEQGPKTTKLQRPKHSDEKIKRKSTKVPKC